MSNMEFENKGDGTLPGLQPLPKDVEFAVKSAAAEIEKQGEKERQRATIEDDTIPVEKSEMEILREELEEIERAVGNTPDEHTIEEIKKRIDELGKKENPLN